MITHTVKSTQFNRSHTLFYRVVNTYVSPPLGTDLAIMNNHNVMNNHIMNNRSITINHIMNNHIIFFKKIIMNNHTMNNHSSRVTLHMSIHDMNNRSSGDAHVRVGV